MMSWEYIAGFLDGEGCISMCANKARPNALNLQVTLNQTGSEGFAVLSEIKEFLAQWGVKSYLRLNNSPSRQNPRYRPMWALSIMGRDACTSFLRSVFPYIHVKKVKAQDTLRYLVIFPRIPPGWALTELNRAGRGGRKPLTDIPIEEIKADRQKGMKLRELGVKYGISYHLIYRALGKTGRIPGTTWKRPTSIPADAIRADRQAGFTLEQLVRKYRIDYKTIYRYIGKTARGHQPLAEPQTQA